MSDASLKSIYVVMIAEATARLLAAGRFLNAYHAGGSLPELEASALQLRKAMEAIAYSAIAPDKKEYAALRAKVSGANGFTKDYHAKRIFADLARINKDFYPYPVAPSQRQPDGTHHFGNKTGPYLTKKRFEAMYDRLGKHLHAHNPWSGSKNVQNLAVDLPKAIEETHSLLDLHVRFIRTSRFNGAWLVETPRTGQPPRIIEASAQGPFVRVGS